MATHADTPMIAMVNPTNAMERVRDARAEPCFTLLASMCRFLSQSSNAVFNSIAL